MGDMNYIGGLVKILEFPKQKIINSNILVTHLRVQFPQVRKNCIVNLTFWGNLAHDVAMYYKMNDYILIEGYLSLNEKLTLNENSQKLQKIEITVLKVYPFFLSCDRSIIGISDR